MRSPSVTHAARAGLPRGIMVLISRWQLLVNPGQMIESLLRESDSGESAEAKICTRGK